MFRPAVLAAALIATPLAAQEGGEMTLTIDGETVVFDLWTGQSDWSGNDSYASINIYARGRDGASGAYSLATLGGEVVGGNGSNPEMRLTREVDGERESLFGEDEETGLALTVDSTSIEGEFLTISGSVAGGLGTSDNYGRTIDTSGGLTVEGQFSVTLGPVE